jgi:hypothetical protein
MTAKGEDNAAVETAVKKRVQALCARFPIYPQGPG